MTPATVARVAERALLVRFHDAELAQAVAKAQVLEGEIRGREDGADRGEKLSLKGRSKDKEKDQGSGSVGSPSRVVLGAGSLLVELAAGAEREALERWTGRLTAAVREIDGRHDVVPAVAGREHRVAVSFGGEEGPDLGDVARECALSPEQVVERLCRFELRVAFVGFAPGFPYLIGLPRELEVPRLASPRARVPARSVAIAGPFAGVYPSATPGGWRLLGRIASDEPPLFDPHRDRPARFAAGDRVRFVPQQQQQRSPG